jgi:hypothetical protein
MRVKGKSEEKENSLIPAENPNSIPWFLSIP